MFRCIMLYDIYKKEAEFRFRRHRYPNELYERKIQQWNIPLLKGGCLCDNSLNNMAPSVESSEKSFSNCNISKEKRFFSNVTSYSCFHHHLFNLTEVLLFHISEFSFPLEILFSFLRVSTFRKAIQVGSLLWFWKGKREAFERTSNVSTCEVLVLC